MTSNELNIQSDDVLVFFLRLLTPIDTTLCSLSEAAESKSLEGTEILSAQLTTSKSTVNPHDKSASLGKKFRHPATSTTIQSAAAGNRRPSSSGGISSTSSRPATPTGRPSLPAMTKPMKSSTPTSKATFPSNKTLRSSTPIKATPHSSTPTIRPSVPATSKSTSRSTTPTRTSRSATPACQSSSVAKTGPRTLKNTRGTSSKVKSRPLKPSVASGLSYDAPNLKTAMTRRPSLASRVRPSAPVAQSSTDTICKINPRQQPCSPSRGRLLNGNTRNGGNAILHRSFGYSTGDDDVNPVLIGTKMVERVVNMRKLVRPKQDDCLLIENSSRKTSVSQDNSGFGRSLSKKSLDMAIRHMDISQSMIDDRCPLETSATASSLKLRPDSTKSKTAGAADTSVVRSRTASSGPSINGNSNCLNEQNVDDNDADTERRHSTSSCKQSA